MANVAYEESLDRISIPVASDLSAKQFYFVKQDTSGNAVLCGAGQAADGVLQDNPDGSTTPTSGELGRDGVSMVVAGGVLTPSSYVTSDANGKAVTAATGDFINGKVMITANCALGDIIPVSLTTPGTAKVS